MAYWIYSGQIYLVKFCKQNEMGVVKNRFVAAFTIIAASVMEYEGGVPPTL